MGMLYSDVQSARESESRCDVLEKPDIWHRIARKK